MLERNEVGGYLDFDWVSCKITIAYQRNYNSDRRREKEVVFNGN